jgi:hypothetical protein
MLRITNEEARKLREQGFKYASESTNGVIHKTHSHHSSYYLKETDKALDALILIREKL